MPNFYNIYNSFEDFYNSFYRGNEVEFIYNGEHYYVLPEFDILKNVVGVIIGDGNEEHDVSYKSKSDMYYAQIDDSTLGCILDKIEIVWYNF